MRDWAHSPTHRWGEAGAYFVTAATYLKQHFFGTKARLDILTEELLERCEKHEVMLQAWAVFPNHYHLVGLVHEGERLQRAIAEAHSITGFRLNKLDDAPGRKVWFQYRDTKLTNSRSYFARLRYVHENAVHHGLVRDALQYPWCSAGWFARNAPANLQRTLESVPFDRVAVPDDFEVALPSE